MLLAKRNGKSRRKNIHHYDYASRWSILKLPSFKDEDSQSLESLCYVLLKRYGIVFRDVLAKEKMIPSWRQLLMTFRRLEDRGAVRGGRFVDGFLGEQFALPDAITSLRSFKKEGLGEEIKIYPSDPLNLAGVILPGPRILNRTKKKMEIEIVTSLSVCS